MYIYNGQEINIYDWIQIEDIRYSPRWFLDEDARIAVGIEEALLTDSPEINEGEKVIKDGYVRNEDGRWVANWVVVTKTQEELDAEATALTNAKLDKIKEIDAARLAATYSSFTYDNHQISCDQLSRSDIDGMAGHVALFGEFPPEFPGAWKTEDGSYISIPDIATFKAMYSAMTTQGIVNFTKSQQLKAQVEAATKIEQLGSIVW